MATESKLGAEQQNTIGKGTKGREHESEGEREQESEREHEGEKEGEAKREQPSERASEREKGGKTRSRCRCPRPCTRVPSSWGDTGPTSGTNEKRSEQKKKEETWIFVDE